MRLAWMKGVRRILMKQDRRTESARGNTMKIVLSYNKGTFESQCWDSEIRSASRLGVTLIPFNHARYLGPHAYEDSVALDRTYQRGDTRLLAMYDALRQTLAETGAQVLFVTNAPPYHPDFLRTVPAYRVLHSTDDPGATYMRTIPYLHGYHHVMHCAIPYSRDMNLTEKFRYCGMVNADWLPLGVMDYEFDSSTGEESLFAEPRDIDLIYVGSWWRQKNELLFRLKRIFGRRFHIHGHFALRHNLYINARYAAGCWVRPVSWSDRVKLYRRAKIGINIHWNEYGLGNQRLYHLAANGAMQISDCLSHLNDVFRVGSEIDGYDKFDELVDKIRYYLAHDAERQEMARRAYRRTMSEYRFAGVMQRAAELIQVGMHRVDWQCTNQVVIR